MPDLTITLQSNKDNLITETRETGSMLETVFIVNTNGDCEVKREKTIEIVAGELTMRQEFWNRF